MKWNYINEISLLVEKTYDECRINIISTRLNSNDSHRIKFDLSNDYDKNTKDTCIVLYRGRFEVACLTCRFGSGVLALFLVWLYCNQS